MKYAIYTPNCWSFASASALADLARRAEDSGWDGFFIWDHLLIAADIPVVDSQIALASIASATSPTGLERIGSLITPLARRRPWKVSREVAALQELAEGRLVVGVGLGQPPEYEFSNTEIGSPPERGAALDDALELLRAFWTGQEVTWQRPVERHRWATQRPEVSAPPFLPTPEPVPPIWVGGAIYRDDPDGERAVVMNRDTYEPETVARTTAQPTRPFRRAARFDGLFPIGMPWDNAQPIRPGELRRTVELAFPEGEPPTAFDVVTCGRTYGPDAPVSIASLEEYVQAGATWWLEAPPDLATLEQAIELVEAGPPRI